MTTEMIAALANRGNIATGDFHLAETLRYEAIPEFWSMLPEAVWRRRTFVSPVPPDIRGPLNMPDDFFSMITVHIVAQLEENTEPCALGAGLPFIGEEPAKVVSSVVAAQPTSVTGYFIGARDDGQMKAVFWNGMPDDSPRIGIFTYVSYPFFANASHSVNMDIWMPELFQQGLIHLLRSKIYEDRYGEGDQRTQGARAQVNAALDRAMSKYALARRNHVVYVD